jgi:asparagine synthase (glutamine-hydrolysing)
MFALAVHDTSRRRVLLARDRFGQKPLYYARLRDGFVFASELRALLPLIPERRLSRVGAGLFLSARYLPAPHTIVDGVFKLEPGEALEISTVDGTFERRRWYDFAAFARAGGLWGGTDHVDETRRLVDEAIRLRLMSDVGVGVFLSGGIDSAVLAAGLESQGVGAMTCLTVDFPDSSGQPTPDASAAVRLAEAHGMRHHMLRFGQDRCPTETYIDVFSKLDEPDANPSCLATHLLSAAASSLGLRVVLTGDGSDEAFLGYRRYLKAWARDGLDQVLLRSRDSRWLASAYAKERSSVPRALSAMRTIEAGEQAFLDAALGWVVGVPAPSGRARTGAFLDLRTWVPDMCCMRTDKLGMRSSIEIRSPFLDHRLQEFTASLSVAQRFVPRGARRPRPKSLLVGAFRDVLPEFVLGRQKQGFNTPIIPWLRRELSSVFLDETQGMSALDDVTDTFLLREVVDQYVRAESPRYFDAMFAHSVLNLILWCRHNLK